MSNFDFFFDTLSFIPLQAKRDLKAGSSLLGEASLSEYFWKVWYCQSSHKMLFHIHHLSRTMRKPGWVTFKQQRHR